MTEKRNVVVLPQNLRDKYVRLMQINNLPSNARGFTEFVKHIITQYIDTKLAEHQASQDVITESET